MIKTPQKPFDTYKWRWLSFAPTEGLLEPPVFLGVLRVLARHENEAPSSSKIAEELAKVKQDTGTRIDLARSPERNLIRNSGQYWKGTGLITPEKGQIHLTSLGRKIAQGQITQDEFAAIMIQQTVLPNPWTEKPEELAKWSAANLEIKPFILIIEILERLGKLRGQKSAFITPFELMRIIIPLAGDKRALEEMALAIVLYRDNQLSISDWPNCVPKDNDHRFAREFLLFLSNFGICRKIPAEKNAEERYCLDEFTDIITIGKVTSNSIFEDEISADRAVEEIRHSNLPSIVERQRTTSTILVRTGQSQFRSKIFKAYSSRCYLTGDVIGQVLEAAHIVPVKYGGADEKNNGFCLRVDIHRLYDSGNIRIGPTGEISYSNVMLESKNYKMLPKTVEIPSFVNPVNLQWRQDYL